MHKLRAAAFIGQHTASCTHCVLPGLCLRAGLSPEDVENLDHLVDSRLRVKRGEDLYRAGDPFSAIYAIRSGFFKNDLVLKDGRSQIMGFHMPGEVLGMEGISAGAYRCNAEALEDAEVCAIRLSRIEENPDEMRGLARGLHRIMSKEIVCDQRVMVLLGGNSAELRLAAFLVDLSHRFAARGCASSDFELPMKQEDIGSFLGLELATVSRMFKKLQGRKLIEVRRRHVRIVDAAGLGQLL